MSLSLVQSLSQTVRKLDAFTPPTVPIYNFVLHFSQGYKIKYLPVSLRFL